MFSLNCFSVVAIVIAAVLGSLIATGRGGGFWDWKWMEKELIQMHVCMGDVFFAGQKKGEHGSQVVFAFSSFCELWK